MTEKKYNILQDQDLKDLKSSEPERFKSQDYEGEYVNLQKLPLAEIEGIEVDMLEKIATVMRGLIFVALESVHSGHPGGSSGKVEQFLSLTLGGVMAFDPAEPKHVGRDRVVWSAGHCTPALHAGNVLIAETQKRVKKNEDYPIQAKDLLRFRHPDGPQGHVEGDQPLADIATGSSGHGLSAAGGLATVHKSCGLPFKTWVFMGDAETEEGMSYESRNLISTLGLTNVIVSLDYNHFGIDGKIEEVINQPYHNYWLGLGWNVIEVDGHNFLELIYAYKKAAMGFDNNLPTVVLAHSIKGKCYGELENTNISHGKPADHESYVSIMKNLGFEIAGVEGELEKDLEVVLSGLNDQEYQYLNNRLEIAKQNVKSEDKLVAGMKKTLKGRAMVKPIDITRPKDLPAELVFSAGEKVATRKATQAWFEWLMKQTAFFYAGTGDLSSSILINSAEEVHGLITKDNPLGRGVRFGIAEQNMAMWSCALTQDKLPGGFQPVSVFSSYGVFTSMMANSVRMALIGNHTNPDYKGFFIMLAAHDGPETGEDGPTHHGLYWMSLFNAYPGIKVYKPLDANETIEMLFYALKKGEPIALSVARPDTLVFARENGVPPASEAINGAYVYKPFEDNDKQKVVLAVAGGKIMYNVTQALDELKEQYDIKIVAVTSVELYEDLKKSDPEKAEKIFSAEDRKLAVTLHNGWPGFLYPFLLPSDYKQRALGIDNFQRSGPPDEVYKDAGFDAEGIKAKIIDAIK